MIPNASGKIAPPRPWIVRATIITASEPAIAPSRLPAARPSSASTSTRCFPNMSPSRPAIGVTTEAASRYEVKIQAAPEGVVSRSRCSTGSAGTTSDWSKRVRTAPEREHAQNQAMVN